MYACMCLDGVKQNFFFFFLKEKTFQQRSALDDRNPMSSFPDPFPVPSCFLSLFKTSQSKGKNSKKIIYSIYILKDSINY